MDDLDREAAELFAQVSDMLRRRGLRFPTATYRLQFNRDFTFHDAHQLVDYYSALGVSDLYSSPFFQARPESMHGYDIVDHNAFNPAIGTPEHFQLLGDRMSQHGLGLMLDFVPNHMGIGAGFNAWWNDVLENGPSSRYATYFDIAWQPLHAELDNKVLLPFLGDHYGRVLERGELQLSYDHGAFFVRYWETVLPINPRTYALVLEPTLPSLVAQLGDDHDHVLELQSILTGLGNLPPRTETKRAKVIERGREKEILKRRLATLTSDSPAVAAAVAESVGRINGTVGDARSFDTLDLLLEAQAFRLSYWRVAAEEINYRRFFDINDLAAIRMENPEVFRAAHRLMFELLADGRVTSLRIDHPDGLWDPPQYFAELQRGFFLELCRRELAKHGVAGPRAELVIDRVRGLHREALAQEGRTVVTCPLYLVVEKILSRGETLPVDWPVYGTSGYDFILTVGGLFVDRAGEQAMTDLYLRFTDERTRFDRLAYEKKKLILQTSLASELNVLARRLHQLASRNRYWRDFTLGTLSEALREVIACFPVYRTYVTERDDAPRPGDRAAIERALRLARRRSPSTDPSVYEFLRTILLLELPPDAPVDERAGARDFVMRLQQLTGPVMAKGVEDTAFYNYNRLVSLDEVGGEPERFGVTVEDFHRANLERQERWPAGMITTSTHDTKRSEDVRARLSVLSEIPTEWGQAVAELSALAAPRRTDLDGQLAPDANEEYLLYQTLVGTWPLPSPEGDALARYTERIVDYMHKATKEAKVHTSWTNSNADYDRAVADFVRAVLGDHAFRVRLDALVRRVAPHGFWNSLAQVLLKLTSPGVPDVYQGQEIWDDSLVDPDNRRPVDYRVRRAMLAEIRAARRDRRELARELLATVVDGRIKLLVTHLALVSRRSEPELFGPEGSYVPLAATGRAREHVVAFARRRGEAEVVAIAPRLTVGLLRGRDVPPVGRVWSETLLPVAGRRYTNVYTGVTVEARAQGGAEPSLALEEVLADLPLALLERID